MSGKKQKKTEKKSKKRLAKNQVKTLSSEWVGAFLFSFSIIFLMSLFSFTQDNASENWFGIVGYVVGWVFVALLGLGCYPLACYFGWIGWRLLFNKPINRFFTKNLQVFFVIFSFNILLSLLEYEWPNRAQLMEQAFFTRLWEKKLHFHLGGAPAYFLFKDLPIFNLKQLLHPIGVGVLFSFLFFLNLLMLMKIEIRECLQTLKNLIANLKIETTANKPKEALAGPIEEKQDDSLFRYVKLRTPNLAPKSNAQQTHPTTNESELLAIKPEKNLVSRPSISGKEIKDPSKTFPHEELLKTRPPRETIEHELSQSAPKLEKTKKRLDPSLIPQTNTSSSNGNFSSFKLPAPTLLTTLKNVDQSVLKKDLRRQAEVLEETLQSFGIEAKVGQINCGPTITSFEVHPAIGVKVQKIKALENDIALNMEAKSIRIIAPIPGKAAIGIEVPNPHPQEVGFKDMLAAYQQSGRKYQIPVLLGKTVSGDYVMEDLAKMPHIIIAGATGSGKSVCINTIVMSILMSAKPDEIKLIMVDPKKVELTPYTKLPHMLAPVITEPAGACAALAWLVKEMENRYELLKQVGFRNILSFNTRPANKEFEDSLEREVPEKLHYIVCIIDELADLMMVSSHDIEVYIARIAQMARAVGIHLILATQRPSREVITGLIKANLPTRLAFKVSSRINSQIILDEVGAESLLGNGDMLFLPPGSHHLVRAQGAYIRDNDINQIVESICAQAPPNYVIRSFDDMEGFGKDLSMDMNDEPKDSLYEQAYDIILSTKNASTTFLQRKLKIGYARAASIIDQLEANGVIGPAIGSKPREILHKNDTQDHEE